MKFYLSVVLLSFVVVPFAYAKPTDAPLNVLITPHTHLDVGWLETFDSYYYLNVSKIIPGVLDNLAKDSSKRFSWAEISYFQKWVNEDATQNQIDQVKALIAKGQWLFIDGGIVQHDQACPTFQQIIDQMTDGHRFLKQAFNVTPTIGWSIDPFGSSASNAALYAMMGFDALVINRIPDEEMDIAKANKSLEFIWGGSSNLGPESHLYTHVFDSYFCMPDGFRWGMEGDGSPVVTDKNVGIRALALAGAILPRKDWYRTNTVLVPWGCDFMYQNATLVFENTDKLIQEINSNPGKYGMTINYATVGEYMDVVHNANITWPIRHHTDFFPLEYRQPNNLWQVWSGFYSSRPALKSASRTARRELMAADAIVAAASRVLGDSLPTANLTAALNEARFNADVILHHDAITGTMCVGSEGCIGGGQLGGDHAVLEDYMSLLNDAMATAHSAGGVAMGALMASGGSSPALVGVYDKSVLRALQRGQRVALLLLNAELHERNSVIRLDLPVSGVSFTNANGSTVPSQMVDASLYGGRLAHGSGQRFSFEYSLLPSLPALGYTTVYMQSSLPFNGRSPIQGIAPVSERVHAGASNAIENDYYKITCDANGNVNSILDKKANVSHPFSLALKYYVSDNDGAYLFNTTSDTAQPVASTPQAQLCLTGPLFDEVSVRYDDQHALRVRLYKDDRIADYIEVDANIGILEREREFVLEASVPDIANGGHLVTENNGFERLTRLYDTSRPVYRNSWPNALSATVLDSKSALAAIVGQTHTVTNPGTGTIQLLLHRRANIAGLSSAVVLDDATPHRELIQFALGGPQQVTQTRNRLALMREAGALFFASVADASFDKLKLTQSFVSQSPADYVQLISLQAQDEHLLARFHHLGQTDDVVPGMGNATTVDLSALFVPALKADSNAESMTLTGLRPTSALKRMVWNGEGGFNVEGNPYAPAVSGNKITLEPLDIATVLI